MNHIVSLMCRSVSQQAGASTVVGGSEASLPPPPPRQKKTRTYVIWKLAELVVSDREFSPGLAPFNLAT